MRHAVRPRRGVVVRALVAVVSAAVLLLTGEAVTGAPAFAQTGHAQLPRVYIRGQYELQHDTYALLVPGHYSFVALSAQRPRYVDAAVAPHRPKGKDLFFRPDGRINGHRRWDLRVRMTRSMLERPRWNVGVLIAGHLHVIHIEVLRKAGSTHHG